MQESSKFRPFEELIATHQLTPEGVVATIETKLNHLVYKLLLVSRGGVERALNGKYNIVLEETLSLEEKREVAFHELAHIHYSEVTPPIECEEDYDTCESILEQEVHRFMTNSPKVVDSFVKTFL